MYYVAVHLLTFDQAYQDAFTAADDFYDRVKSWADQYKGKIYFPEQPRTTANAIL